MEVTRRKFIRNSMYTAAGIGLVSGVPFTAGAKSTNSVASDTIRIGLIGCKSQGFYDLQCHLKQPNVVCSALCDVDQNVLEQRASEIEKMQGKKPLLFADYRKMLESKDVDALIIATPDHWHCLQMVEACQAGKDVYVEKPMANTIEECNLMVRAAKRYNRVVTVGQQQRSDKLWQTAMQSIWDHKLGSISKVKYWANFNYGKGQTWEPDSPVPAGVNFDMWLGPAPARSFNKTRFHGSWRMFWDYGGGLQTDWGVHLIDMGIWATQLSTIPKSVSAIGGNFAPGKNSCETADTQSVLFEFDKFSMVWDHNGGIQTGPYGRCFGIEFIGENGTIVADRSNWENFPEWDDERKQFRMEKLPKVLAEDSAHEEHAKNFIESIRSRNKTNCEPEVGRMAAIYTHLANIAYRTGTKLKYDELKNSFVTSPEHDHYITPIYRSPWALPKV
jgi:predicted dehydrogenase